MQDSGDSARLAALARYQILDTAPELAFDDIVLLASRICETPIALVSLVDVNRQWFKARVGLPVNETPLAQSVCAHALQGDGLLIIPDLTADERTRHNTLVTEPPAIRFYAGALLRTPDGLALGTLCVIDTVPRPAGLTLAQTEALQALARQVVGQLELRRALKAAAAAEVAAARHQDMLRSELSHRLKNILSIVQSIVSQTLRTTADFDAARQAVMGRIVALGRAQDLVLAGALERAGLASIVDDVASLYHDGPKPRFSVSGPAIEVGPRAALAFALMMHELATNAAKYGALSVPNGRVSVSWTFADTADAIELLWREEGGPPVATPSRRGFGTRLIERALADEIGGTVALGYPEAGLECRLTAPLAGLRDPAVQAAAP